MTAGISTAERPGTSSLHKALPIVLSVGLLLWLAVVAVRAALLVLEPFALPGHVASRPNYATPQMWGAVALITLTCLGAALLTRRLTPAATLPVTVSVGGIVVLAGAVGTGSVGSLLLVLGLFALAWLLGETLLHRFPTTADAPVVRVSLAIGLGLGFFGLLLLGLASLGWLTTAPVVGSAGVIVLVSLLVGREHLPQDLVRLRSWRPAPPSWLETTVLGLSVGMVAYAALVAFVPEVHSDAVRQHLPVAREIWQASSAPEFDHLPISRLPLQAHLLYAVAYGLGDMTAAKLVHTCVGLVAILGVAGIAWLGAAPLAQQRGDSQRLAAVIGGAVFATLPLVLWELGTAYVDLFPVLFTVGAVLAILLWQRNGYLGWLIVAGALAGFGFAAKLTMGLVIVALVAALGLVGRGQWQWRERLVSVVAFGLGGLVVLPWLLRNFSIVGTKSGVVQSSAVVQASLVGQASNPDDYGTGRSLLSLLRIPWDLAFSGGRFSEAGAGDIGILLLLLLLLVLLSPRTRTIAFLGVTLVVSFLAWALITQHTRHSLSVLALASALIGVGVASAVMGTPSSTGRLLQWATSAGVALGLIAAPIVFIPSQKFWFPVDVIIGMQPRTEVVIEKVPAASAFAAADALLPPDTPIAYIGLQFEGMQLYTEARLQYFGAGQNYALMGESPDDVLASLDHLGVDYVVWSRAETPSKEWRSTLLSTGFLRENTRILAGERSGYLFEIVPNDGTGWGQAHQNLLTDPGLDQVRKGEPWTVQGKIIARKGVVAMEKARTTLSQSVAVTGGTPYLLTATGKCPNPDDYATLTLRWFDIHGVELSAAAERVIPGSEGSEQFLWHHAPERATSVSTELSGAANCEFEQMALYTTS